MNRKNLLLIIFALLLVFLGNWLAEEGVKQVVKRQAPEPGVQQDYYLNDFSLSAMDEQGHLQHRLQAKQLSHFTAGEKTELQQPELMVFKQDKVAWQVVAERGEINQRQDDILLLGGVQLNQLTGNEPLRLTTSSLHILPKQGRANTNQPITLTQAGKRIDAIGMEIEREGQRLLLLSQVRGRYETLVH